LRAARRAIQCREDRKQGRRTGFRFQGDPETATRDKKESGWRRAWPWQGPWKGDDEIQRLEGWPRIKRVGCSGEDLDRGGRETREVVLGGVWEVRKKALV
jgi:hypothetical protein